MACRPAALLLAALAAAPAARAEEPCAPVKPCEIPEGEPAPPPEEPADLAAEARGLLDLLACRGASPQGLSPAVVSAYCRRREAALARLRPARERRAAELRKLLPERLPSAAVLPMAGADLLAADEAFPGARNVTLASVRPAGDPRLLGQLHEEARLRAVLDSVSAAGEGLLDGRGASAAAARNGQMDSLPLLLWAVGVEGGAISRLRYFRIEPGGTLHYLGPKELAALQAAGGGRSPFESCELELAPGPGAAPGAPGRIVRLVRGDLSDDGLARDPAPLSHLAAKGSLAVLLHRGPSLAGGGYGGLRELLLKRAALLLADETGPTAEQARQAGLIHEVHPLTGVAGWTTAAVSRRP